MDTYSNNQLYKDIVRELREPFPPGTVQSRNNNPHSQYIPAQAYEERLEEVADMYWSWSLKGEPIIYERENEVQITGTLKIVDAERDGTGFATFQRFPEGKIKNLKYAIRAAAQDALRDACDHFQMGWVNLGKNSHTGNKVKPKSSEISSNQNENKSCMVCKVKLTQKEVDILRDNGIKLWYCSNHLPKHLVK
ncbi:hypothetical protein [Desertibacillus haloalkaliphilus]|uniref:hypothetical protein n=1 Tax=Desertibacillus haloalkaliphilus TaxID=1328930 RepID=UPI001C263EBC|nr:hypothetical protein [Desertibacillus haloalkaliphilus]MBU8908137.1 hypothetical protein [Desertibacillus haloalkaliphilus]